MSADFYTNTHSFRRMEYNEVKELKVGDEIAVCVHMDRSNAEFASAIITKPMFCSYDTLIVETDKGFVDIYSIYEVKKL